MNTFQKAAAFFIVILSALISSFSSFLLGEFTETAIFIALTPLLFGRLFYGKNHLRFLEYIYVPTVVLQVSLQVPAKLYPEAYSDFFLELLGIFMQLPERGLMGNMNAALFFEPVVASIIVFGIAYSYREGYLHNIYRSLT